ncbi:DUF2269 family protein [Rossellomorea aquimaris]|uniref:DUF2269 family protein n=1 Tax=Rossellomorea aquimaris TaxID=189382 RepID=UPI0037C50885
MEWLILLHVLSAIIGVGPTFFAHVLTRPDKTIEQLKVTTELNKRLEYFPKIGGSIALLTGFILFYTGDYGSFAQLWILGSVLLYVFIQLIVIGFITPVSKKITFYFYDHEALNKVVRMNDFTYIQKTIQNINTIFQTVYGNSLIFRCCKNWMDSCRDVASKW